ncbi:hypothetical protein L6452_36454 [Arctium lappa]|uniref:Uncharacterized protein n=1 Tax=Arctium lappa TaxID=4217 RepID=A0ACB8YAR1_ARCLA|nr:hypothetical protein L6452_36454 [Arctium lappa]
MDYQTFFLLLSFLLTCIYAVTLSGRRNSRLPPGPDPFPIIGNLLQLTYKPHRSLATLSKRYGPLMSLKLGSRTTIVVSSPDMAKEFFLTHDMSFSSRSLPDAARVVDHHKYSMVWLPVGDQWRRLRRITKEYLYSAQRSEATELILEKKVLLFSLPKCTTQPWGSTTTIPPPPFPTRPPKSLTPNITSPINYGPLSREKVYDALMLLAQVAAAVCCLLQVQDLLDHVNRCCTSEKVVNIGAVVFTTILDIFFNILFSTDFAENDSVSSQEFKDAVWAILEVGGKPNLADFFPILKLFDPQGLLRHGNVHGKKLITMLDMIIDQRLQTRSSSSSCGGVSSINNDVLDSLLNLTLKEESGFSRNDMKHWFLVLFIAGTDTTTTTLEWAMTELIRNPEKMEIARSEFDWKLEGNMRALDMDMGEKFGITLPKSVPLMAIPIKL